MSDLSAGSIKLLNGLNPKQSIGTPKQSQNVQLNGINFDQPVNIQQKTVNSNWNNDGSMVTTQNYGTVPANDDLPPIFDNVTTVQPNTNTTGKSATVAEPTASSYEGGTATGIGMAIGAVGGFFVGRGTSLGVKLGIGLGVAVGGVAGYFFEK